MAKTPQQKEAAEIWRDEQAKDREMEISRSKAYYLHKYLSDIGPTGYQELDAMVEKVRGIAEEIDAHYWANHFDNASTNPSQPPYAKGDSVRLISYHKDNRPTTIRYAGPYSCGLEEARGGFFTWNYFDIEPYNKKD